MRSLGVRLDRLTQWALLIPKAGARRPRDLRTFIERLPIINKKGELTRLRLNPAQEIIFQKLMEKRRRREPARFICLKSRQMGVSTFIQAYIFGLLSLYPNRFGLVAAHSIESASSMFAVTRRFLSHGACKGPPAPAVSARRIEFPAPHNSSMRIDTAANRKLGRGLTLHYVHAGEVAFWDKPEEPILAINQAIPYHWDTLVFWESTANGPQNLFHREWAAAEKGGSAFDPIFLSWKIFPEYSLPVAEREALDPDPKEAQYARDFELTAEQLKWAMLTKRGMCRNSWEKFHQEYPAAPELAFSFTGLPWFEPTVIRIMLSNAATPQAVGALEFGRAGAPVFSPIERGPLALWRFPQRNVEYVLGMDVGEGVSADYTVIQVVNAATGELVARWRSNRVRPEAAGVEAYLLGRFYNNGLLGIERNGPGLATLAVCENGLSSLPDLTPYPNLYYHTFSDRKEPEQTKRLGWITNRVTKEAMLNRLAETFSAGGLTIYCRETLLEMRGFIWDPEKRLFRQNYKAPEDKLKHDDDIIALAIANEMRHHARHTRFFSTSLSNADF